MELKFYSSIHCKCDSIGLIFELISLGKNLCFEPHFSPKKTTAMTEQQLLALEEAITALREKLTGDMFADMEVRDEIHNLEMQLKGVKPLDSHFDCVGCGS
jgi:hypothetical protein